MKKNKKTDHGGPPDLKAQAIDGAFWNVFFSLANKTVTFVGQLVLAWFLLPSDMGLANMAQAMAAFTAILSVGGLADVLIQRKRFNKDAGQALWVSIVFSALTSFSICVIALASSAFGRAQVRDLLFLLAMATMLGSPCTVLAAGLRSRLDFKGMALSNFVGGLCYTSTATLLAWRGWGPYSLILPLIPKYLAMAIFMWLRGSKFRPIWPKWADMKDLMKPTLAMSFTGLFTGLQFQAPVFICGLVLDPAKTGFFSWGWAVAGQTVFLLALSLREILLPTFIQIENNPARRMNFVLKTARTMTALLCVACGAQALLAETFIKILVPEKWFPAIPVVIFASLGLVLQGLWISGMAWLNACGRYRLLLKTSAFQAILAGSFTWLGAISNGINGASMGCAFAYLIGALTSVYPMGRTILLAQAFLWIKPLGLSAVIWVICRLFSSGQQLPTQILASMAFVSIAGLIWWESDNANLKTLAKSLLNKLLISKAMLEKEH